MSIDFRPRIGIAAQFGPLRAGLRAMLGEEYDCIEASTPTSADDLDLWIVDADAWEPVNGPFLLLSDSPTLAIRHGHVNSLPFGVLHRDVDENAFRAGVSAVLSGLVVLEPDFARVEEKEVSAVKSEELTSREQEVLQLLALGLANKEIAKRMGISIHTVKFHAASILAKLGAASRTEAVTLGAKRGWVVF